MRELVSPRAGEIEWRTYAERPITPNELRFRSLYSAAKHGTSSEPYRMAFMIRTMALTAAPWPKPLSWLTVPVKYRSRSGLWNANAPD